MDAVIVVDDGRASCRKLREVRIGERVVCGLEGIRVTPEFRERERADFAFMSNEVSSERRVEVSVGRIARDDARNAGAPAGASCSSPARSSCTPAARAYFTELIRRGCVDVLLAGNALAVHDAEQALFGTSLGVDLESRHAGPGRPSPSHARHQRHQPRRRASRRRSSPAC